MVGGSPSRAARPAPQSYTKRYREGPRPNYLFEHLFLYAPNMAPTEPRPRRPEVSEGMAAARRRGVRLGRPSAPLPDSARRAAQLRDEGNSLAQIAPALNAERV